MKKVNDFKKWFKGQQKALSIEVKEVSLSEMFDWKIINREGKPHYIGHTSGKYHRGVFLHAWDIGRKMFIERFLLAPIPPEAGEELYGVALLARYKDKYLVQAKSEPGNKTPGHVQITSTIHASYNNIEMKLSGDIPFTWMYKDPKCEHFIVSQDGAQLYLKNNKVCFLELNKEPDYIPTNFAWATLKDIKFFSKLGLVSEHVMQCLGVSLLVSKDL